MSKASRGLTRLAAVALGCLALGLAAGPPNASADLVDPLVSIEQVPLGDQMQLVLYVQAGEGFTGLGKRDDVKVGPRPDGRIAVADVIGPVVPPALPDFRDMDIAASAYGVCDYVDHTWDISIFPFEPPRFVSAGQSVACDPAAFHAIVVNLGLGDDSLQAASQLPKSLIVNGGAGTDRIWGGPLNDYIDGGPDGDDLSGGEGRDVIDGGLGPDNFWPTSSAGTSPDIGPDTYRGGSGDVDTVHYEHRRQPTHYDQNGLDDDGDCLLSPDGQSGTSEGDNVTEMEVILPSSSHGVTDKCKKGIVVDLPTDPVEVNPRQPVTTSTTTSTIVVSTTTSTSTTVTTTAPPNTPTTVTVQEPTTTMPTVTTLPDDGVVVSTTTTTQPGIIIDPPRPPGLTGVPNAVAGLGIPDTLKLSGTGDGIAHYHKASNTVVIDADDFKSGTPEEVAAGNGDFFAGYIKRFVTPDGDDTIHGNDTGTIYETRGGKDRVFAGSGKDEVYSGGGDDTVDLGGGTNKVTDQQGSNTITGGPERDEITTGNGDDTIAAGDGPDRIQDDGNIKPDGTPRPIAGGCGDDTLIGSPNADALDGGCGNDTLYGGNGPDVLIGGSERDTVSYSQDTLGKRKGKGNDYVGTSPVRASIGDGVNDGSGNGAEGDDIRADVEDLIGSKGDDTLIGSDQPNSLDGGKKGDDTLIGKGGADTFEGGSGKDTVSYSPATGPVGVDLNRMNAQGQGCSGLGACENDTFVDKIERLGGGSHGDLLTGTKKADVISGLGGNDTIRGENGRDELNGDAGADRIFGGSGKDEIDGGADADPELQGDGGADKITGGSGADQVFGGGGKDKIFLNDGQGDDAAFCGAPKGDVATIDNLPINDFAETRKTAPFNVNRCERVKRAAPATGTTKTNYAAYAGVGQGIFGVIAYDGFDNRITVEKATNGSLIISDTSGPVQPLGHCNVYWFKAGAVICPTTGIPSSPSGNVTAMIVGLGDGNDSVDLSRDVPTASVNSVTGGPGNDTIVARDAPASASGTLDGGEDNDLILSGRGRDRMLGGAGDTDTVAYFRTEAVGASIDGVANDGALGAGEGDNVSTDVEVLMGGFGSDALVANPNPPQTPDSDGHTVDNTIVGGPGSDYLVGGNGNDLLIDDEQGAGLNESDTVVGGAGNDTLESGDGQDFVFGQEGSDEIDAGDGDDAVDGGPGSDQLGGSDGDDLLAGGGGYDEIEGGDDVDTVDYSTSPSGITLTLDDLPNDTRAGTPEAAMVGSDVEVVVGSKFNDSIEGSSDENVISGGAGADTIKGGDGADTLDAGDDGNANNVQGGDGDDSVTGGFGPDVLNGGDGDDAILGERPESAVNATGADVIDGGAGDDELSGMFGNDVLKGGIGDDTIAGGPGINTLDYSGHPQAVTVDLAAIGEDQGAIGEQDQLRDYFTKLIGSSQDDELSGNGLPNEISGGEGGDTINGRFGDDALRGGGGNNTISGGEGNDWMSASTGDDEFYGDSGTNEVSYEDRQAPVGATIGAAGSGGKGTSERDTIADDVQNLTGGQGNDTLVGGPGENRLDGGPGADSLSGRTGDDFLDGGSSHPAWDGPDTLRGELGNDRLVGGVGDDALEGGEGEDWLAGDQDEHGLVVGDAPVASGGADALDGGGGGDVLLGDGGSDRLSGGAGQDIALGAGPTQQPSEVNTLDYSDHQPASNGDGVRVDLRETSGHGLPGEADISVGIQDVIGTAGKDTLTGNDEANTLDGRGGDDQIVGEGGNDRLLAGTGRDGVAGGSGQDTIRVRDSLSDHGAGGTQQPIDCGTGNGDTVVADQTPLDSVMAGTCETVDRRSFNEVFVSGGELRFLAEPDDPQPNDLLVAASGSSIRVEDRSGATLTAGASCTNQSASVVNCPQAQVSRSQFELGGGDDRLELRVAIESQIRAGDGDDRVAAVKAKHAIDGGLGADTIDYSLRTKKVNVTLGVVAGMGEAGEDTLSSFERVIGSPFNDTLTGSSGDELLVGGPGNDSLTGGGGDDELRGDADNDMLTGGLGDDRLSDSSGTNDLLGGAGDDTITGGSGEDTVAGEDGNDLIDVRRNPADRDRVLCGNDFDIVTLDALDLSTGCEELR